MKIDENTIIIPSRIHVVDDPGECLDLNVTLAFLNMLLEHRQQSDEPIIVEGSDVSPH